MAVLTTGPVDADPAHTSVPGALRRRPEAEPLSAALVPAPRPHMSHSSLAVMWTGLAAVLIHGSLSNPVDVF